LEGNGNGDEYMPPEIVRRKWRRMVLIYGDVEYDPIHQKGVLVRKGSSAEALGHIRPQVRI
jgi:hypothetical protein